MVIIHIITLVTRDLILSSLLSLLSLPLEPPVFSFLSSCCFAGSFGGGGGGGGCCCCWPLQKFLLLRPISSAKSFVSSERIRRFTMAMYSWRISFNYKEVIHWSEGFFHGAAEHRSSSTITCFTCFPAKNGLFEYRPNALYMHSDTKIGFAAIPRKCVNLCTVLHILLIESMFWFLLFAFFFILFLFLFILEFTHN